MFKLVIHSLSCPTTFEFTNQIISSSKMFFVKSIFHGFCLQRTVACLLLRIQFLRIESRIYESIQFRSICFRAMLCKDNIIVVAIGLVVLVGSVGGGLVWGQRKINPLLWW